MPLSKEPFRSYELDGEREEKGEVFSIRLNKEERSWLEQIKEDLNIKSDGKALKTAAFIGKNVLHGMLGRRMLRYLFKNERLKYTDFKNF